MNSAHGTGKVHFFDIGSGWHVEWTDELTVDDDELPAVVRMKRSVENGRLVCESFTAERRPGGEPITVDVLRALPVVNLISVDLRNSLLSWSRKVGNAYRKSPRDLDALKANEVEYAACVYRAAYFMGLNPTLAVAETLGLTRDAAAKRVQAARRAGLLDPTTKGKKGA